MAKIPEYFSQAEAETSRLPRATAGLADTGQGLEAQALVGLGGALGKVGQLLADIEIEKQRARDNVTLAEMKGALDDFEFTSRPDPTQFTKIEDFKKAEVQFGKDWQRESQRISKGSNRRVSDQFKIYTELHWDIARKDYHNKSWPLEQNYALAQFDRLWSEKLQNFVSKPVKLKGELQALIKQFDAYLKPTQKQNLEAGLDKSIESNQIQTIINLDPISAMEAIDNLSSLFDEKEKNILRSQTRTAINRKKIEAKEMLAMVQEKTDVDFFEQYSKMALESTEIVAAVTSGRLDRASGDRWLDRLANPRDFPTNPAIEADLLRRIEDPTQVTTRKDILNLLGKGLSVNTTRQFLADIDVFKDPYFVRADRYLKSNLGWSDETTKFLHPEGSLAYHLSMNELLDAIETEKIKGRDILNRAAEISIPYLMDYWQDVLILSPEQKERLGKMLGVKAEPAEPESKRKVGKPKKETRTETEKKLDDIWK